MRVGIALGSNIGDRLANFQAARKAIVDLVRQRTDSPGRAGVNAPILSSSIYETEPVDCEPGAARFFNAVLEFDYESEPQQLLKSLKAIEQELGRPGDHPRNVSRKIDIDFLYAGEMKMDNEDLHLPHPRMHLRRFVLEPLAEIRSDLILPGQKQNVGELLANLKDSAEVVRANEQW
jgi:2-amino-4-hydroxy-6-hydroxymethyldihydropteridine diphosphokinase